MPFVERSCVFTKEFDKVSTCELDFLVSLVVLSARDGAKEVVKGITADKKRPLLHNLASNKQDTVGFSCHDCLCSTDVFPHFRLWVEIGEFFHFARDLILFLLAGSNGAFYLIDATGLRRG